MHLVEKGPSRRGALLLDSVGEAVREADWSIEVPEPLGSDGSEASKRLEEPRASSPPAALPPARGEELTGGSKAREVFLRWERLRIAYNVIVLLAVLPFALAKGSPGELSLAFSLLAAGIIANVGYLIGPCAELYLRWLGLSHRSLPTLLFTAQSLFAVILAAQVV